MRLSREEYLLNQPNICSKHVHSLPLSTHILPLYLWVSTFWFITWGSSPSSFTRTIYPLMWSTSPERQHQQFREAFLAFPVKLVATSEFGSSALSKLYSTTHYHWGGNYCPFPRTSTWTRSTMNLLYFNWHKYLCMPVPLFSFSGEINVAVTLTCFHTSWCSLLWLLLTLKIIILEH